jgi:ATP-dependent helicase YprA (DUF1998 family)
MTSATIQNPKELGENLTGLPVEIIDQDGSPQGAAQLSDLQSSSHE